MCCCFLMQSPYCSYKYRLSESSVYKNAQSLYTSYKFISSFFFETFFVSDWARENIFIHIHCNCWSWCRCWFTKAKVHTFQIRSVQSITYVHKRCGRFSNSEHWLLSAMHLLAVERFIGYVRFATVHSSLC